MAAAKKIADRPKAKAAKSKESDSSSDELEKTNGLSSDDEIVQRKRQRRPLFLKSAQRR